MWAIPANIEVDASRYLFLENYCGFSATLKPGAYPERLAPLLPPPLNDAQSMFTDQVSRRGMIEHYISWAANMDLLTLTGHGWVT